MMRSAVLNGCAADELPSRSNDGDLDVDPVPSTTRAARLARLLARRGRRARCRRPRLGENFGRRCWRRASRRASASAGRPPPRSSSASHARSTAPRFECRSSRPCASLVILATPPAMVTRGNGMRAQIFQHAADEIAHVDERDLGQVVELLDRGFGGRRRSRRRCGRARSARATSMPRWIEWIQAEHE